MAFRVYTLMRETTALAENHMETARAWPKISITIPCLNQGKFLEVALQSCTQQNYPNLEIFVFDGGSQDISLDVIKKFEDQITYWRSAPDNGQSHAINQGWKLSSGDLISYLNSDDYLLPDALRKAALAWNYNSDTAMVCGGVVYVDENGNRLKEMLPKLSTETPVDLSTVDITKWYLPQQASFYSRQHLDQVGRWLREELHYVMDRELIYRLGRSGKIVLVPEILAADRKHGESKRIKSRLEMYREDAAAMKFCTWGDQKAYSRRKYVARQRLAQGFWFSARDSTNRTKKIYYFLRAILLRPSYLVGSINPLFKK